jgi:hypothetical protein
MKKERKFGPGQPEPAIGHFSIRIYLKKREIWAWPARAPNWSFLSKELINKERKFGPGQPKARNWSFFNKNLFEKKGNLGLASQSPKLVISQ